MKSIDDAADEPIKAIHNIQKQICDLNARKKDCLDYAVIFGTFGLGAGSLGIAGIFGVFRVGLPECCAMAFFGPLLGSMASYLCYHYSSGFVLAKRKIGELNAELTTRLTNLDYMPL